MKPKQYKRWRPSLKIGLRNSNPKVAPEFFLCIVLFLLLPSLLWGVGEMWVSLGPGARSYSIEFAEPLELVHSLSRGATVVIEVLLTGELRGFLRLQEERFYQGTLSLGYDIFLQVWTLHIDSQPKDSRPIEYFEQPSELISRLRTIDLPVALGNLRSRLPSDEQLILEARFLGEQLESALWVLRPFLWGRTVLDRQVLREVP